MIYYLPQIPQPQRKIAAVLLLSVTTTKTQVGVARLIKSVTQTQAGVSLIQATVLKTQTGTARIRASATKTQIGISRIQVVPSTVLTTTDGHNFGTDTTPTLEFVGSDGNSDDITYEVEIVSSYVSDLSTFNNNSILLSSTTNKAIGQSFTGDGGTLSKLTLNLSKIGVPTGNAVAHVYAHSGTYGTSSIPTGAPIATSDNFNVATLTSLVTSRNIIFSGVNKIVLTNATNYVIAIEYTGGDGSNNIQVGYSTSVSPHTGNANFENTSNVWTAFATSDLYFYLTCEKTLNKLSNADSGFLNLDNGGDTNPFTSGDDISFTVQAGDALHVGSHSWRVRGKDPTGTNTFGAWTTARVIYISETSTKTQSGVSRIQVTPTIVPNTVDGTSFGTDTTPTIEFTGTDGNNDDIEYQIQISQNNTFPSDVITSVDLTGSPFDLDLAGFFSEVGQSFQGTNDALSIARFRIKQSGTSGTLIAKLYAHSGTYGTSSVPDTGTLLATSNSVNISTVGSSYNWVDFTFSSPYTVVSGTNYVIVLETSVSGGASSAECLTDPAAHSGNLSFFSGFWSSIGFDLSIQLVKTVSSVDLVIDKTSVAHAGFLNTVNGGDTHPFTSSEKVSFTVQAGDVLIPALYYWRVRAVDLTGTNAYSSWTTTRSFYVYVTTTKTQIGISRITSSSSNTQAGVSRIRKSAGQTQTGFTRITTFTQRNQTGKSAVQNTTTITRIGVSRITKASVVTHLGKAAIYNTTSRTQVGVSRVTKIVTQIQTGISAISKTVLRTQTGLARIQITSISSTLRLWTPYDTSSPVWWVDATQLIGYVDNDPVISWDDSSGNGVPATNGVFNAPHYKTNQLNGHPVVNFVAANNEGLRAYPTVNIPYSIFAVARIGATSERLIGSVYPEHQNWVIGWHSAKEDVFYANGWVEPTGVSPTFDWKIYSATGTGAVASFYSSGNLIASNSSGVAGVNGGIALSGYGSSSTSELSDGDIAEVLMYTTALTDSDRERVEGYLAWKYGRESTLPIGHVYKSNPPMFGEEHQGKACIQKITTVTQTGKAAITNSSTRTQSGKAAIRKTTSFSQIGASRIRQSATNTQTGLVRIRTNVSRTQTGLSRITSSTLRTQNGVSNIYATTVRTQIGVSRIQKTILQTQIGVSRILKSVLQIQLGKAFINTTFSTTRTQGGVSRIQKTVALNRTGVSRITLSVTGIQTGKASIQATTLRTQVGVSRILRVVTLTQIGLSRIQKSEIFTQTGISRIRKSVSQIQNGLARITSSTNRIQLGLSAVRNTTIRTQLGKADVQLATTRLQLGISDIRKTTVLNQIGVARIRITTNFTQTGTSRIGKSVIYLQTGLSRITSSTNRTQLGVSAVRNTNSYTVIGKGLITGAQTSSIDGRADIRNSTTYVQTGIARIGYIISKTQIGLSRLQNIITVTQTGVSRIVKSVLQTQTGISRLQKFVFNNQIGVSRVQKLEVRTQSGVARIYGITQQTQIGIARVIKFGQVSLNGKASIRNTSSNLQLGVARIRITSTKIQVGVSRINQILNRTQNGLARITASTVRLLIGKTSIYKITIQAQTGSGLITNGQTVSLIGVSDITNSSVKTQVGIFRVQNTVTVNRTGKASIRNTNTRTQSGLNRITQFSSGMQLGLSRITGRIIHTQLGLSRIGYVEVQTQIGKSRVTNGTIKTQFGAARVRKTGVISISGLSRIRKTILATQIGSSRITAVGVVSQIGKSRITKTSNFSQAGVSRIRVTSFNTQVGKSLITSSTLIVQSGSARIINTATTIQSGLSRITQTRANTQIGCARIGLRTQRVQLGTAHIIFVFVEAVAKNKSTENLVTLNTNKGLNVTQSIKNLTVVSNGTEEV